MGWVEQVIEELAAVAGKEVGVGFGLQELLRVAGCPLLWFQITEEGWYSLMNDKQERFSLTRLVISPRYFPTTKNNQFDIKFQGMPDIGMCPCHAVTAAMAACAPQHIHLSSKPLSKRCICYVICVSDCSCAVIHPHARQTLLLILSSMVVCQSLLLVHRIRSTNRPWSDGDSNNTACCKQIAASQWSWSYVSILRCQR